MKLFFSAGFFLVAFISAGQVRSLHKEKNGALYIKENFFDIYPRIMSNGQQLKKDEIASAFAKVPEASIFIRSTGINIR